MLPSREEHPAGETRVAHGRLDDLHSAVRDEVGDDEAAVDIVDATREQRGKEREILVLSELFRRYRPGHERT